MQSLYLPGTMSKDLWKRVVPGRKVAVHFSGFIFKKQRIVYVVRVLTCFRADYAYAYACAYVLVKTSLYITYNTVTVRTG